MPGAGCTHESGASPQHPPAFHDQPLSIPTVSPEHPLSIQAPAHCHDPGIHPMAMPPLSPPGHGGSGSAEHGTGWHRGALGGRDTPFLCWVPCLSSPQSMDGVIDAAVLEGWWLPWSSLGFVLRGPHVVHEVLRVGHEVLRVGHGDFRVVLGVSTLSVVVSVLAEVRAGSGGQWGGHCPPHAHLASLATPRGGNRCTDLGLSCLVLLDYRKTTGIP